MALWKKRLKDSPDEDISYEINEHLPPGHSEDRATWVCLNRLRAGVARTRIEMRWLGFLPDEESVPCVCGAADETVSHFLECKLMGDPVSRSDLAAYNEKVERCVVRWRNVVHDKERKTEQK